MEFLLAAPSETAAVVHTELGCGASDLHPLRRWSCSLPFGGLHTVCFLKQHSHGFGDKNLGVTWDLYELAFISY